MSYLAIRDVVHPSQKSDKLENLLAYCKQKGVLFVDQEFPPESSSLFLDPPHPEYKGQWNRIAWKKARELFGEGQYEIFKKIEPSDIRQGSLGDCYFLCSLASLAEQPELIQRLFDVQQVNEHGVYAVWLNINGSWKSYILDEYFPVSQTNRGLDLAFSKTDQKELWVILLEKAYAKAYGSYWDIVGGDPVHALRDLTGAPYDRIEDFSDLNAAWEKLKVYNSQNFIITCFTKSTKISEEKSAEGMVAGHAYSILDVREIMDSRGQMARLLQIRNPWGKFEWTGSFSDSSPLWTPEAKRELKLESKDDGVFWMPLEDFIKYYEGIGILKTFPGFSGNSVLVKRVGDNNLTLARLTVRTQSQVTISIDQIDSRVVDNSDYSYSYFRVTIGKLQGKDSVEFIDCILSPERNVFLENSFAPGSYIILVEAYWSSGLADSFTIGTYSDSQVEIELVKADPNVYRNTEYTIWKQFALNNRSKMEQSSSRVARDESNEAKIDTCKLQQKRYANILYSYFNNSQNVSVHTTFAFVNHKGFNPVAKTATERRFELLINPNDNDIILFNMDPRSQGFTLSFKATAEELIPYKFSKDVSNLEYLNALGGVQPTLEKKEDTELVSRMKRKKEIEDREKQNKEIEDKRKRNQDSAIQRAKEKRKKQIEEHNTLMQLLKKTQEMMGLGDQNFFNFGDNALGSGRGDPFSIMGNAFFNDRGNPPAPQPNPNVQPYKQDVRPAPVPPAPTDYVFYDGQQKAKGGDKNCLIF